MKRRSWGNVGEFYLILTLGVEVKDFTGIFAFVSLNTVELSLPRPS